MDAIECLLNRRSVKQFSDKPVEKEKLEVILNCGKNAPSGMSLESAKIIVVNDKDDFKMLKDENAKVKNALGKVDLYHDAPTILVIVADKTIPTYVNDGSLVAGNILNAAYALGVGACWIHRAKEVMQTEVGKAMLKKLGLDPDKYEGIANIALGYPRNEIKKDHPHKEDYIIID